MIDWGPGKRGCKDSGETAVGFIGVVTMSKCRQLNCKDMVIVGWNAGGDEVGVSVR